MGIEADNDGTPMGDYIYKATRLIVVEPKAKKGQIQMIKRRSDSVKIKIFIFGLLLLLTSIVRFPAPPS